MSGTVRAAEVLSQAKINLRLRILAREDSGFHQLETLFLRVELSDTVRVRRSATRSLDVRGDVELSALGPVERNLAWRAADAYLSARGLHDRFAIEIDKRIPIGGGLGGGSADAGGVLRCLDAMSHDPIGEAGLLEIAACLGSDVPFLTSTHPYALAWGRGERMLALHPPEQRDVALLKPNVSVATATAYGWLAESRRAANVPAGQAATLLDAGSLSSWPTIASIATNDFEPVVSEHVGEIAEFLAFMRQTSAFDIAMMSGSGSTLFGISATPRRGLQFHAEEGAPERTPWLHITTTATRVEPVLPID